MAVTLGLTWMKFPAVSVTRMRSFEVSKIRRRSSISWVSAFCVRLLSVMSCAALEMPTILPEAVRIGEMLSETSMLRPSLCTRDGFIKFDRLAAAIRSTILLISVRRSGGTMM